MSARDQILARIRAAVAGAPDVPEPARDYLATHTVPDPATLLDLLRRNLADYRAHVHRAAGEELPALIAGVLAGHGVRSLAVPPGLPAAWLADTRAELRHDSAAAPLTPRVLDSVDAVVTGCALAVAETGTIVLDGSEGQGRRALTLVPDLHVCVVRVPGQVVASLPQALPRLDPARPLTWISGPSATSDIELDRVEGVHGPRTLHVVLLGEPEDGGR
ncbi:LutC/YkgG family protein [Streptomyces sp. NRRL S-118]|uniref:LutC/YkgG family protein n=1 Tax=Streptomyces sp. NRRL S-118 TaxID=1463881 RepID=UPI0004C4AD96|nr:LUD domain-containing protein [Streptomyces sp. NRRL S-118]